MTEAAAKHKPKSQPMTPIYNKVSVKKSVQ